MESRQISCDRFYALSVYLIGVDQFNRSAKLTTLMLLDRYRCLKSEK